MVGGLEVDLGAPIDISIPLKFNGPQPNAYGVNLATSHACESGDIVGDTRRGGSCNFEQYTLIPHCNGTHTECVGHITNERISIRDRLIDVFFPAVLVSVQPELCGGTGESYASVFGESDLVITSGAVHKVLERSGWGPPAYAGGSDVMALVVRTLPNDDSKLTRRYGNEIPPYFTNDAITSIVDLGFSHLLVDLPSIDRLFDEGKLSNHRIFWNVDPDSFEANAGTRKHATITELIYVPESVPDGIYLLNLQIAPFAADASPSRPMLFTAAWRKQ